MFLALFCIPSRAYIQVSPSTQDCCKFLVCSQDDVTNSNNLKKQLFCKKLNMYSKNSDNTDNLSRSYAYSFLL